MDNSLKKELEKGYLTSLIDNNINSNTKYRTEFISNNHKEGKKVLSIIERELSKCDEFYISVAFITMGGLTPLLQILKELEDRGIKGKILTTDYLTFSDPKALKKLNDFKNLEVKLYKSNNDQDGFHTKGYIFKEDETYRIIIGSSNITLNALTINKEWNTKIVSSNQGEYSKNIILEFNNLWKSENSIPYSEIMYEYETRYRIIKDKLEAINSSKVADLDAYKLEPNSMQVDFINSLNDLISKGEDKALLISATGTGKTYASAFAVRDINPKRMLFIVHREQIAIQAQKSYRKVFSNLKSMGILSGAKKEIGNDFIFSTMQTLSKDEVLNSFKKDEFDVIVIDEVHRAGASSYGKIIDYFTPKLMLGMSASPDRTDGFDIYKLFNHNIAHEIRLKEALEEDLLCPFHYFGISDFQYQGNLDFSDFRYLSCEDRINYIIEKIKYYGYSGDRVKGLIFCSTKEEARNLSVEFNKKGFNTVSLTGEDSQSYREKVIERLVNDFNDNPLDYIITVDIFNEGVDIPEINQVIMLRPTESPIIFIQQLGRGLRKYKDKEYVVILDFIGNYSNNYMIPMALYGDRSYNKDNIRNVVREGNRIIPGASTIHFDEISRKRIYESIDSANFSDLKIIKDSYNNLKFKLGKIPKLMDFERFSSIDPIRFFESNSLGSYTKFLVKYEKDYKYRFSNEMMEILEFISRKFVPGKRVHELILLKLILNGEIKLMSKLKDILIKEYGVSFTDNTYSNLVNIMTNNFLTGGKKNRYKNSVLISYDEINKDYSISNTFSKYLENDEFRKIIQELIDYGIYRYKINYTNNYKGRGFNLYKKYTYEDVSRLLDWEIAPVELNIGGYMYNKKTNTYPVFINYDKDENIKDTIKYEDRFIDNKTLIAMSKSGRSITSSDIITALNAKELGVKMDLFVRKNKDDKVSKEFYYMGEINATGKLLEVIMENTNKKAVEIEYELDTPIREDLFEYIVEK